MCYQLILSTYTGMCVYIFNLQRELRFFLMPTISPTRSPESFFGSKSTAAS